MSEHRFSEDDIQQLKKQNQQLANENLRLREEIESYKTQHQKKTGKKLRKGLGWAGAGIFLGRRLKKSLEDLYAEIPQKKVSRETLAAVTAHILWRFTRISILGILFALIPASVLIIQSYMMYQQGDIMKRQSAIMNTQNELVETQNNLIQVQMGQEEAASKRSLYAAEVEKIEDFIRSRDGRFRKDDEVLQMGKTIALTINKMEPYRIGPDGTFNVSPEYGQILLSFITKAKQIANLEEKAYLVYGQAFFDNSDLEGIVLTEAPLRGIQLSESNLIEAKLRGANLENARLNESVLNDAVFIQARLFAADFSGVSAQNVLFRGADMRRIKFIGADLTGADFRGVERMNQADFTSAKLLNVKVSSSDFLQKMSSQEIKGWSDIQQKYRVNQESYKDGEGTYYIIEEK